MRLATFSMSIVYCHREEHLGAAVGRCKTVTHGGMVWTVATGKGTTVAEQTLAALALLERDPAMTPQPETYWGNVNPIGPRGVYDEAKRFAEAMVMAYHRYHGLETRIVRIFNTYGPRMHPYDGRVVSNFIVQALLGQGLTVYGDGSQSRSFCYVSDEVEGIFRLFHSDGHDPVNIGNPDEYTIGQLAERMVREVEPEQLLLPAQSLAGRY